MALWHHVSLLVKFEMDASSRRTRTARLLSCHCQHAWKFSCLQQSQHRKGKSQPAAQLFTVTIQIVNKAFSTQAKFAVLTRKHK